MVQRNTGLVLILVPAEAGGLVVNGGCVGGKKKACVCGR